MSIYPKVDPSNCARSWPRKYEHTYNVEDHGQIGESSMRIQKDLATHGNHTHLSRKDRAAGSTVALVPFFMCNFRLTCISTFRFVSITMPLSIHMTISDENSRKHYRKRGVRRWLAHSTTNSVCSYRRSQSEYPVGQAEQSSCSR
jgi:hypothetical protein